MFTVLKHETLTRLISNVPVKATQEINMPICSIDSLAENKTATNSVRAFSN